MLKKTEILNTFPSQGLSRKGIIAAVTNFMNHKEGNITYIDQYVDRPNGAFFMRIESDFIGNSFDLKKFKKSFNDEIGNRFSLNCNFYLKSQKPKMAVFVSKYDHCLYDILAKQQSGELAAEIPFILSNHLDLEIIANRFEIPFYHVPVSKETKANAENMQLNLLKKHNVDFNSMCKRFYKLSNDMKNLMDLVEKLGNFIEVKGQFLDNSSPKTHEILLFLN